MQIASCHHNLLLFFLAAVSVKWTVIEENNVLVYLSYFSDIFIVYICTIIEWEYTSIHYGYYAELLAILDVFQNQ